MVYVPRRAAVGSSARSVDVSAPACPQPGVLPIRRNLDGRLLSYEQLSHDWKKPGPVPWPLSLGWHTVGRTSCHGANFARPRATRAVQPYRRAGDHGDYVQPASVTGAGHQSHQGVRRTLQLQAVGRGHRRVQHHRLGQLRLSREYCLALRSLPRAGPGAGYYSDELRHHGHFRPLGRREHQPPAHGSRHGATAQPPGRAAAQRQLPGLAALAGSRRRHRPFAGAGPAVVRRERFSRLVGKRHGRRLTGPRGPGSERAVGVALHQRVAEPQRPAGLDRTLQSFQRRSRSVRRLAQ